MKKLTLFTLMVASCFSVFAQRNGFMPIKHNAIKFNLLSPIFKNLSITSQHVISNTHSINLTASYMNFNDFSGSDKFNTLLTQGFSFTPEFRFNYTGIGLNGFYVAPFLRYQFYKTKYQSDLAPSGPIKEDTRGQFQSIGLGVVFGKQFIIKNTILIDFFMGPSYQIMYQSNMSSNRAQNYYNNYSNWLGSNRPDNYLGSSIPKSYLSGYGIRAGITIGIAY